METLDEKIAKFKLSVAKAADLQEPWAYFFDELAADDRFLDLGKVVGPEAVTPILQMIAVQALKNKGQIVHQMSLAVPDYDLIHGSCIIDNNMTTYCFVQDLNMGIACFLDPRNQHAHMIRFTQMTSDKDKDMDKAFIPRLKSRLIH